MKTRTKPLPWSPEVRVADSVARSHFLESHLDLVRYLALRLAARLPASVDVDDLVHDGILGLLEATERYDPARGFQFRTFAERRIRGAILDGLRRKDWRPRSVRQSLRRLDQAMGDVSTRQHRAATDEEVAEALGLDLGEYVSLLADVNSGPLLSLDDLPEGADPTDDDGANLPDRRLERKDLVDALAEEIGRLPERERHVLGLYYSEGLNMKEVGAVLGITESRVCQLHAQAASRLRVALRGRLRAPVLAGERRG